MRKQYEESFIAASVRRRTLQKERGAVAQQPREQAKAMYLVTFVSFMHHAVQIGPSFPSRYLIDDNKYPPHRRRVVPVNHYPIRVPRGRSWQGRFGAPRTPLNNSFPSVPGSSPSSHIFASRPSLYSELPTPSPLTVWLKDRNHGCPGAPRPHQGHPRRQRCESSSCRTRAEGGRSNTVSRVMERYG